VKKLRGSDGGRKKDVTVEVKIRSLEASVRVVENATGERPNLEDPELEQRFAKLRGRRVREDAKSRHHWNAALRGLVGEQATEDRSELKDLLSKAGFQDGIVIGDTMPSAIESYTRWTLSSVTPVSRHSAIYSLTSKDRKRATPHPRGRGRQVVPVTFHTTLLAEIGQNGEGPLPWIEREYTPVSTAREWDLGRCELLVKIYKDGLATSWLRADPPPQFWLSTPMKTLHVPSLNPDGSAFSPASVLLLLAGTGVVALPQILAHRDPCYKLGISTPRRWQLRVPIDLLFSCREDDVLLLPEIAQWCRDGEDKGLRHCTLMLTPPNADGAPPFPDVAAGVGDGQAAEQALEGVANAGIVRSRLSPALVTEAVGRLARPCRVVVSGPGGFNTAARELLAGLVEDEEITILAA
jgi:hypothetical protein